MTGPRPLSALLAAASLFPEAAITMVHAFSVPYERWLKSEQVSADVEAEVRGELDAFLADLDPKVRDRLDARLTEGETSSVVVEALAQTRSDLLVLGTHGRSGFIHAALGSHAEALLGLVDVDTLVVRERK